MKKYSRGKRGLLLLLCVVLILGCCGCKSEEKEEENKIGTNWSQTSKEEQMSIYCALIKEYMLLTEDLGKDTPYPAMKRSVKGSMMSSGLTLDEALEQAKEVLIQEEAVFWRSKQDGMEVTDADVKKYMQENVIREIAMDENYDNVSRACEKEGITFEDSIWAYENSYKVELIGMRAGMKDYEELENYKAEAVAQFKKSKDYAEYQKVLETCDKMIRENVTDKEILKKAEIFY